MTREPWLLHNPDAAALGQCDPWVRGVLLASGDLFVWDLAGASHAKLRAALEQTGHLPPDLARVITLDVDFQTGVDVQRIASNCTFALSADTVLDDLQAKLRQRVGKHLAVGQARHAGLKFEACEATTWIAGNNGNNRPLFEHSQLWRRKCDGLGMQTAKYHVKRSCT